MLSGTRSPLFAEKIYKPKPVGKSREVKLWSGHFGFLSGIFSELILASKLGLITQVNVIFLRPSSKIL
jgi:hypothetical protein